MSPAKTSAPVSGKEIDLAAMEAELRPLSADRLRDVFFECYGKAAEFIARGAMCVKLMEERGESLKGLPQNTLPTFRKIACGQVLPELVWKFIESPARKEVERLPIPDQKKLAQTPVLPVAEPAAGGGYTKRMVDLTTAPASIVRQVIGPEGVRSPDEQIAHIAKAKARVAVTTPDPVPAAEPLARSVSVKLTESEYAALQVNAARGRRTVAQEARRGLLQSGVLKEK